LYNSPTEDRHHPHPPQHNPYILSGTKVTSVPKHNDVILEFPERSMCVLKAQNPRKSTA
jgi:hypothetical protein